MLVTEGDVRQRAAQLTKSVSKSAKVILREQASTMIESFDVFLSHSKADEEIVLGAKGLLEDEGLTVYVDWIDDPQLDRSKVNHKTADVLRARMSQCAMLLYIHSTNSKISSWMPWELGYFDGREGKIGIFPIENSLKVEFDGQEYLGLYPYVDYVEGKGSTRKRLWINRSFTVYANLARWLKGQQNIEDRSDAI